MPIVVDDRRIEKIWTRFKRTGATALRDALIEHYLPLVKESANRLRSRLPAVVQEDDLVGAGALGLMDAICSFQPGRGVKFATFSAMRIRGAILDEIRALDWAPRLVRSRCRQLEHAARQLEAELGRPACDEELAERLQINRSTLFNGDWRAISMMSLSGARNDNDSEGEMAESPTSVMADPRAADPEHEAQRRMVKQLLTRGLSRAERLVVTLYYFEEMTMREIGQTLDLSESRVSQMHSEILKHLKSLSEGPRAEELLEAIAA